MKALITFLTIGIIGLIPAYGQNVAVWDFTTRNGEDNQMTENFTYEFEEALVNYGNASVLERRNMDRLVAVIKDEKAVQDILQMSESTINDLKQLGVEQVVFGEIFDDIDGGEISISVTFQELNGRKAQIKSAYMRRGLLADGRSRRDKMKELVKSLSSANDNVKPQTVEERPTNRQVQSFENVFFTLNECKKSGGKVDCFLTLRSDDRDSDIAIYSLANRRNIMLDNNGNEYHAVRLQIGNNYDISVVRSHLVAGVTVSASLSFNNVSRSATKIPLLNVAGIVYPSSNYFLVEFRDIPLINE